MQPQGQQNIFPVVLPQVQIPNIFPVVLPQVQIPYNLPQVVQQIPQVQQVIPQGHPNYLLTQVLQPSMPIKMNMNDRLIEASKKGDIVEIKSLLKEGADVNFKDNSGRTSLIYASVFSNGTSSLKTVELLISEGADVNAKDNNGQTSLMFSSAHSNSTSSLNTAELLLDNGADVNAKDKMGQSSLFFAINAKDLLDTVRLLLSYGADPFVKTNKGKYPLDLCKTNSCKKIISTSMWEIMNNNVKKLSGQYSTKTPISKNIWELILLRNKQRQLCKDLKSEKNKYVLQGFAGMLSIPIAENMTKSQLCNLVSKQLSWGGKYSQESVKYLLRKDKLATIGKDIRNLANSLGINTDQPVDNIMNDISAMVGTLTTN